MEATDWANLILLALAAFGILERVLAFLRRNRKLFDIVHRVVEELDDGILDNGVCIAEAKRRIRNAVDDEGVSDLSLKYAARAEESFGTGCGSAQKKRKRDRWKLVGRALLRAVPFVGMLIR